MPKYLYDFEARKVNELLEVRSVEPEEKHVVFVFGKHDLDDMQAVLENDEGWEPLGVRE